MTARRVALLLSAIVIGLVLAASPFPRAETATDRADRIASELRCPVCQGLSAKDSPSETAREIRALVARRVAEGRTDDQIRDEFRAAYGDWVLLSPPLLGASGLVWLLPFGLLGAGLGLAWARIGRAPPATSSAPTAAQVEALRERVAREEAQDA